MPLFYIIFLEEIWRNFMNGKIIKGIGGFYYIKTENGIIP